MSGTENESWSSPTCPIETCGCPERGGAVFQPRCNLHSRLKIGLQDAQKTRERSGRGGGWGICPVVRDFTQRRSDVGQSPEPSLLVAWGRAEVGGPLGHGQLSVSERDGPVDVVRRPQFRGKSSVGGKEAAPTSSWWHEHRVRGIALDPYFSFPPRQPRASSSRVDGSSTEWKAMLPMKAMICDVEIEPKYRLSGLFG